MVVANRSSILGSIEYSEEYSPGTDLAFSPDSGYFYRLLITFANSLDPDQARQNVGPDLDPNCLTL